MAIILLHGVRFGFSYYTHWVIFGVGLILISRHSSHPGAVVGLLRDRDLFYGRVFI